MSMRFRKSERLTGRAEFRTLAENGSSFREGSVRLKAIKAEPGPNQARVAFSVPKRIVRNAVDRNRIKRRMRSAYRALKTDLYRKLDDASLGASLLFIYLGRTEMSTKELERTMERLLQRWIEEHEGIVE